VSFDGASIIGDELDQVERRGGLATLYGRAHVEALLASLYEPCEHLPESDVTRGEIIQMAHHLLGLGLELKWSAVDAARHKTAERHIIQGAELLEYLSVTASDDHSRQRHLLGAVAGYYVGKHHARAYVLSRDMMDRTGDYLEHRWLALLLARDFSQLRTDLSSFFNVEQDADSVIASALTEHRLTEEEALDRVFALLYARALSHVAEYPKSGASDLLDLADDRLLYGRRLARAIHCVDWWWLYACTQEIIRTYTEDSTWTALGEWQNGVEAGILPVYVRSLYANQKVVELWPSQLAALKFIGEDERQSFVVTMPTSSGKTRVAELSILRFLLDTGWDSDQRCIYIAPFRALAFEVEEALSRTFRPLAVRTSHLYGGGEVGPLDEFLSGGARILIGTQEKLDAMLRQDPELAAQVGLAIVDEGHLVEFGDGSQANSRGLRLEAMTQRLINRAEASGGRVILLSAVLPNSEDFARWISGSPEAAVETDWRPSRTQYGLLLCDRTGVELHYTDDQLSALECSCSVPDIAPIKTGDPRRGLAWAALYFAARGQTMVYAAQPGWADGLVGQIMSALGDADGRELQEWLGPMGDRDAQSIAACERIAEKARNYLGPSHPLVMALERGFAVHHGGVPKTIRTDIERLYRERHLRLLVATSTVMQGVNLGVRTLIVHSLRHEQDSSGRWHADPREFHNLCGRAGRATTDTEGHVLIWLDMTDAERARSKCGIVQDLIAARGQGKISSALRRVLQIITRKWQAASLDAPLDHLMDYLAQGDLSWLDGSSREEVEDLLAAIDGHLLSLDVEAETRGEEVTGIRQLLPHALALVQADDHLTEEQTLGLLDARLRFIREVLPEVSRRRRYYRSGLGLPDCELIEAVEDQLREEISRGEDYLAWDIEARLDYILLLSEFVLGQLPSVGGSDAPPDEWTDYLSAWLRGETPASISRTGGAVAEISSFVDEFCEYRLPWGLNSITAFVSADEDEAVPEAVRHLPSLVRSGVHDPVALHLVLMGMENRRASLRVAHAYDRADPSSDAILQWIAQLTRADLDALDISATDAEGCLLASERARRRITERLLIPAPQTIDVRAPVMDGEARTADSLRPGDRLVYFQAGADVGILTLDGEAVARWPQDVPLPDWADDMALVDMEVLSVERCDESISLRLRMKRICR